MYEAACARTLAHGRLHCASVACDVVDRCVVAGIRRRYEAGVTVQRARGAAGDDGTTTSDAAMNYAVGSRRNARVGCTRGDIDSRQEEATVIKVIMGGHSAAASTLSTHKHLSIERMSNTQGTRQ